MFDTLTRGRILLAGAALAALLLAALVHPTFAAPPATSTLPSRSSVAVANAVATGGGPRGAEKPPHRAITSFTVVVCPPVTLTSAALPHQRSASPASRW